MSRRIWINAFGRARPLGEWARDCGISRQPLPYRLRRGWTAERALTEPIHRPGGRVSENLSSREGAPGR